MTIRKTEITDIDWDTEDCEGEIDLPESVTAGIDFEEGTDPDETIADWLSNEYGFCVNSFSYGFPEDGDFRDDFGEKVNGTEAKIS